MTRSELVDLIKTHAVRSAATGAGEAMWDDLPDRMSGSQQLASVGATCAAGLLVLESMTGLTPLDFLWALTEALPEKTAMLSETFTELPV